MEGTNVAFLCDHQLFLLLVMVLLTFPAKGQSLEIQLGILVQMAANKEPKVRLKRNASSSTRTCHKLNFANSDIKP